MKRKIIQLLKWIMYLLGYRERIVYRGKTHYVTIKRPTNDGTKYVKQEEKIIMELHEAGKTNKQIGKRMGRTKTAIAQRRYIIGQRDEDG